MLMDHNNFGVVYLLAIQIAFVQESSTAQQLTKLKPLRCSYLRGGLPRQSRFMIPWVLYRPPSYTIYQYWKMYDSQQSGAEKVCAG